MKNILRAVWIVLAVFILVVTVIKYDGRPNSDIEEFLGWTMVVIGFPGSLLGGALIVAVAYIGENVQGSSLTVSVPSLVFEWLILAAAGYLQWFYLLPKLWRRFRGTR